MRTFSSSFSIRILCEILNGRGKWVAKVALHLAGQTACRIFDGIENRELIRSFGDRSKVKLNTRAKWVGAAMRRILVVDDDRHVCRAIQISLEQCDDRVAIADGGTRGLAALGRSTFDLMIVDIIMPHMRGFKSIRIFHERAPSMPLVAISGYAFSNQNSPSADGLNLALRLGATRCLRKPFVPATLLGVIDECISEIEPHRKYIATLTAVADALSEPRGRAKVAFLQQGEQ
jgi:CheY-like chemotaxis protein